MAWTTTKKLQHAVGNNYVQVWEMTADSATLEHNTGLSVIDACTLSPASMNSANSKYTINVLSGATAQNGYLCITGCTSGDRMFVTVYGR